MNDAHHTTVSKARKEAKTIARSGAMTHAQALDDIARRAGHSHWKDMLSAGDAPEAAHHSQRIADIIGRAMSMPPIRIDGGWMVRDPGDYAEGATLFISDDGTIVDGLRGDSRIHVERILAAHDEGALDYPALERVDPSALKGDDFHRVVVGHLQLTGCMSADGPYISAEDLREKPYRGRRHPVGGVALGHCAEILLVSEETVSKRPDKARHGPGWWICKYDAGQPRVPLVGIDEEMVRAIAAEFGMEFGYGMGWDRRFIDSPAFRSLVRWVRRFPKKAKRDARHDNYVNDWHRLALDAITREDGASAH